MTQRRRTDPDVVHRIQELTRYGYSGPGIERVLSADDEYADRLPSLRTIQNIASETEPDTEWWSVADASVEEARLVLPVLHYRGEHLRNLNASFGRAPFRLAKGLGQWIAKVRGIVPSLPLDEAYRLALRFWMNPTPALDEELAHRLEGAGQLTDVDRSDGIAQPRVIDGGAG